MPKLKAGTVVPTVAEDKAITTAARRDPDAKPLTDANNRGQTTISLGGDRKPWSVPYYPSFCSSVPPANAPAVGGQSAVKPAVR